MKYLSRAVVTARAIKFVTFNICGVLFLWWLILDDPRRKPMLFVLIPVAIIIDLLLLRYVLGRRTSVSFSLIAVYVVGTAYGLWWAIHEFRWWKAFLLLIPLSLLIMHVRRILGARGATSKISS